MRDRVVPLLSENTQTKVSEKTSELVMYPIQKVNLPWGIEGKRMERLTWIGCITNSLVSLVLKDAYFKYLSIQYSDGFLWFVFEGIVFQFKVLLFGLSTMQVS